jgi:hypothetical protein
METTTARPSGSPMRRTTARSSASCGYLMRDGERIAAVVPADFAEAIEDTDDAGDVAAADEALAGIEAGEPTFRA